MLATVDVRLAGVAAELCLGASAATAACVTTEGLPGLKQDTAPGVDRGPYHAHAVRPDFVFRAAPGGTVNVGRAAMTHPLGIRDGGAGLRLRWLDTP
ncbi:hypothetical protein UB44_17025 [Burkholderiaceae bacterium 26]|nr:hypothetical protein UB44_17025 [Burkholderiaceae bacterium 26]